MNKMRFMVVLLSILMVVVMMPMGAFALDGGEEADLWQRSENVYEYAIDGSTPKWEKNRDIDLWNFMRISGKNRIETSLEVAEYVRTEISSGVIYNVILVSGSDFPDALGAAGPAYSLEAPIILVDTNSVKRVAEYVGKNLYKGEGVSGQVFIMGGKGAVPENMESELAAQGIDPDRIMRIAGSNRYATNMAVLDGYSTISSILVCSGKDFADALSASGAGMPILLVGDKLTDAQKQFLKQKKTRAFGIVGGTGAVSEEVEAELRAFEGSNVYRFSGKNRFETSKAFAEALWNEYCDTVVLSYGLNFPDGLSGATMCFIFNAPMLLATNSQIGPASAFAHGHDVERVVVMGGESLISEATAMMLLS